MTQSKMLNYLLGTTSKVEILRVLYESDDAMTGRRIASLANISPRSCQLSLDSLVKNKALFRKAVGRAYSYTINRDHRVIWELLAPVFETERGLAKEAAQLITKPLKAHGSHIISVFWTLEYKRTGESVKYVIVADQKKSFPEKEVMEQIDSSLELRFGYPCSGEVVAEEDLKGKYFASVAARKRFERSYAKLKGLALADILGPEEKATRKSKKD